MIRHYEQIGLIPAANRTFSNYRIYTMTSIHTLRFIKKARALGFPIKKIGILLSLYQDRNRSSADVKRLALEHIAELEVQIKELGEMSKLLKDLTHHCHGDTRPECPILDGIVN